MQITITLVVYDLIGVLIQATPFFSVTKKPKHLSVTISVHGNVFLNTDFLKALKFPALVNILYDN